MTRQTRVFVCGLCMLMLVGGLHAQELVERIDDVMGQFVELNAERFPDEANCYDSLGEAYLLDGQREKGIAAYKKALEVDPEFENARQVLERLGVSP